MKRGFETAECEVVWSSIFRELRYEKHENRMKGCDVEQKLCYLWLKMKNARGLKFSRKGSTPLNPFNSHPAFTLVIFTSTGGGMV